MDRFRAAGRLLATAMSALQAVLAPWLDLAVRAWLAQAFLLVQLHEMMRAPEATPALTAPLGLGWWLAGLHDVMASSPGLVVQTVCPLLLAAGLLARPAALAMLSRPS
jgi:uncharacterized membrane protein YphA (DoxX/SURF4 family)